MKNRLKLNPGDELILQNSRSKGPMAETDIYTYSIVSKTGEEIGSVVHTDHTSINGFKRTQTVVQKDSLGNVTIDKSW
ncbi:MAG: hypothetical protein KAT04_08810 [Methylococcales bacterium]|nr:hypothetical protein [Methylococcales bacterium]